MPNINDIVQIAEAMEKSPIAVVPERCVKVRNRNASCRKCIDVCQVNAIEVHANEFSLDASLCMACGACATVCPTEALAPVAPADADLAYASAEASSANDGISVFACARMASKHVADPTRFAEVPCLARMEESLLLSLASHGATGVVLVDGNCQTCKYRACDAIIAETVSQANRLLEAHGSDVRVERASEFPADLVVEDAQGMYGSTRRGFFSEAAGSAKETVVSAARTTIEQELGYGDKRSIAERLRASDAGDIVQFPMPRHEVAINALDAMGAPSSGTIGTRLFGTVDIDVERCNSCGMCAVFCPTGALRRDPAEKPLAPLKYLEFSASECVQCGLCVDVCWKDALTLSGDVPAEELYDFEPRTFHMKGVQRKHGVFNV